MKKNFAKGGKLKTPLFSTEPDLVVSIFNELFLADVKNQLHPIDLQSKWLHMLALAPGDLSKHLFVSSGSFQKMVPLEEYADYVCFKLHETPGQYIHQLATRAAGAYNSLVHNAKQKAGTDPVDGTVSQVYFVDLLQDNLKFKYQVSGPSVADPAAEPMAWVAFRFKFAYAVMESGPL